VKRTSIEFMIAWLDALRRGDLETLRRALDSDVVWHGLREEWSCCGPDEVVAIFAAEREARPEIDAVEVIGAEEQVILHARGAALASIKDVSLPDGVYNVFTLRDGKVVRIDDHAERAHALAAASLGHG
jgi:ketosteroid isomerase-like protein